MQTAVDKWANEAGPKKKDDEQVCCQGLSCGPWRRGSLLSRSRGLRRRLFLPFVPPRVPRAGVYRGDFITPTIQSFLVMDEIEIVGSPH